MKCSVYIATSADGYIATTNGGVDWLHSAGNLQAEMYSGNIQDLIQKIESCGLEHAYIDGG
jgi:dihydrofolate reductase